VQQISKFRTRADMAERHGRAAVGLRPSLGRRIVVGVAVAHRYALRRTDAAALGSDFDPISV
jgi:hypothetical protein